MFKRNLTTATGAPVADNQNSLTAGPQGPIVFEDFHLFEKLATFNRERIPERVVHAKGSGAFGEFIATRDLSRAPFTHVPLFFAFPVRLGSGWKSSSLSPLLLRAFPLAPPFFLKEAQA